LKSLPVKRPEYSLKEVDDKCEINYLRKGRQLATDNGQLTTNNNNNWQLAKQQQRQLATYN
jgi:hypothetical protein